MELPATLEELCGGATKAVPHTRRVFGEGGDAMAEGRRVAVQVEPGMADGTTFVFEG